jgi:UDP:flavonoid glycosyltransferase YjiC (YdhE family)
MREEPQYSPPQHLADFLHRGPEPVYIGFGSIVLDDPDRVTRLIKESCQRLGVRVIVSRGWSKLGGSDPSTDEIFYLGDCPHGKRVAIVGFFS